MSMWREASSRYDSIPRPKSGKIGTGIRTRRASAWRCGADNESNRLKIDYVRREEEEACLERSRNEGRPCLRAVALQRAGASLAMKVIHRFKKREESILSHAGVTDCLQERLTHSRGDPTPHRHE